MGGCISSGGVLGNETMKKFFIKAVNPGYTVDGVNNVGEMIEICRGDGSDDLVSLAGLVLDYTNSSGNRFILVEFPEHTYLAGESILLSLASSPESELAAMTFSKTLAFKAKGLRLLYSDEILDEVCWDSSEGCEREFRSKEPTVLVRKLIDGGSDDSDNDVGNDVDDDVGVGEWSHVLVGEYEFRRDAGELVVREPEVDEKEDDVGGEGVIEEPEIGGLESGEIGGESEVGGFGGEEIIEESEIGGRCGDLVFSEILSYYKEEQSEQFIELHNVGLSSVVLDGCTLKYKNRIYPLVGEVGVDGYYVRRLTDFAVAKDPSKTGLVELLDARSETVDVLEYPHGQKKGVSYALVGYDDEGEAVWEKTYVVTPGAENVYQEFQSCEEGKRINPATGNCVKVVEAVEKTCPAGYYLNASTNRCRKIPVTVEKICEDGFYLNEETGRCKRIVENGGVDYALEPETFKEESSFVGLAAVLVVVVAALIYVIFEFRHEILKKLWFFRR